MIKKILKKCKNGLHTIFFKIPNLKFINYQSTLKVRLIDTELYIEARNLILTTYFTSKKDPQRQENTLPDDFGYIEDFYKSIVRNGLNAVIFYDALSEDFIKKYANENVQFFKVQVGDYSLNDERFIVYYEFLQQYHFQKIILCDVSDVVVNRKDVFEFIKTNKFNIGRDEKITLKESFWILDKIDNLPKDIKTKLPVQFYAMPLVNAGVIGGDYDTMKEFLLKLKNLIAYIDNDLNNNMICVNLVFFDLYWRKFINSANFKIKYILNKNYYRKLTENRTLGNRNFHIGVPFVSDFKKHENPKDTNHYIYHK